MADGGVQELGHQAEADVQRELLLQGQALGVQEGPVIWRETAHNELNAPVPHISSPSSRQQAQGLDLEWQEIGGG